MTDPAYRGRFAPSPSGLLHAGSMVAALASWLDARVHGGRWLVRIEDVDATRCKAAHGHALLHQLAACGLLPDEPPVWQSQRGAFYQRAFDELMSAGRLYACDCSRQTTAAERRGAPQKQLAYVGCAGRCRVHVADGAYQSLALASGQFAWRVLLEGHPQTCCIAPGPPRGMRTLGSGPALNHVSPQTCRVASGPPGGKRKLGSGPAFNHVSPQTCRIAPGPPRGMSALGSGPAFSHEGLKLSWTDRRLGAQSQCIHAEVGDFIVRRRDQLWAYQLAVVVDDAQQGITHVVRGADLADNTPRQIHLQNLLGLPRPQYLHTPLVVDAQGRKLSKHHAAQPIDVHQAPQVLRQAAAVLGLDLALTNASVADMLAAAVQAWGDLLRNSA
jgi:glutamyl-Q tRNA(Asp) synthetase